MWADCDDILAMLGEAIAELRCDNPDVLNVANDLALVHAAVSARRDRASSDRSPVPAVTASGRGEGAVHRPGYRCGSVQCAACYPNLGPSRLTLIRGEGR